MQRGEDAEAGNVRANVRCGALPYHWQSLKSDLTPFETGVSSQLLLEVGRTSRVRVDNAEVICREASASV